MCRQGRSESTFPRARMREWVVAVKHGADRSGAREEGHFISFGRIAHLQIDRTWTCLSVSIPPAYAAGVTHHDD